MTFSKETSRNIVIVFTVSIAMLVLYNVVVAARLGVLGNDSPKLSLGIGIAELLFFVFGIWGTAAGKRRWVTMHMVVSVIFAVLFIIGGAFVVSAAQSKSTISDDCKTWIDENPNDARDLALNKRYCPGYAEIIAAYLKVGGGMGIFGGVLLFVCAWGCYMLRKRLADSRQMAYASERDRQRTGGIKSYHGQAPV